MATEDAVGNLCGSLDNLGAIVNEYQDLSAPPNTIDDVRAINEQVETAFDDVANAAQELAELDLVPLDGLKDELVLVVDEAAPAIEDNPFTGGAIAFRETKAKSLAVVSEIEDLISENC